MPSESFGLRDPASSSFPLASVFIGREAELSELEAALDQAMAGRGRLVLVGGEPGIGKSTLVEEQARQARSKGALVLTGRCWEAGGAPAYWPWTQVLRSIVRGLDPAALKAVVESAGAELVQILPELASNAPGGDVTAVTDPVAARFRLFDSAMEVLRRISQVEPVVVVLEDVHSADAPSLLLLRFVAAELDSARVLILATYRDTELEPGHPLIATLGELSREPATRRLRLRGLDRNDVGRFIELATGVTPSRAVVESVHRETEGNPLFVTELVEILAEEGRLDEAADASTWRLTIPLGVRATISRRLGHLPERCRQTLAVASVLGREFDLDALKRISDRPPEEVAADLERASASRVVGAVLGAAGRLRFSHALVRDALYEELPPTRRYDLHRLAGEMLERLYGASLDAHLAELAHHFVNAAPGGEPARAVDYARRAGHWALDHLAYEEAARLYRMALGVLDAGGGDAASRCDVLLGLGEAQLRSGEASESKQTFLATAELARAAHLPEALARAALGYGGRQVWGRRGRDPVLVPLLREALDGLSTEDGILRARLMARLAGALRDKPDPGPRDEVSRQAVAMARRLGDPATLAYALTARYTAIWGPHNTDELLAIAEQLSSLAELAGDRERMVEGHLMRHKALMTLGRLGEARTEHEESLALSAELRQPAYGWYAAADRAAFALLEGRFSDAEGLVEEAYELGRHSQRMEAETTVLLQRYALRREQGRLGEMEEAVGGAMHSYPWYPLFRCVRAHLHAELGRRTEARQALDELAEQGFAAIPRDNEWLFALAFLPEVAAFVGDSERAGTLYELLLPYRELTAYSPPELFLGPVSLYVGILAAVSSRLEDAQGHLDHAMASSVRMGARPWLARSQHALAGVLLDRDGPGDRDRAHQLLHEAGAICRDLGMVALGRRIAALSGAGSPDGDGHEDTPTGPAVFRREGDYWSVAFEGRALRLRDSKGLAYLHRLLSEPGREFHVAELASLPGSTSRAPEGLAPDAGHAGELLDPAAKAAYRQRVEELRDEIAEAEEWNDPERAARAREELDFIASELASAFGLGGRVRRGADTTERIRKAVTNRIRDATARIGRDHPELGRHLANAVSTGTFCSYGPERPISWRL